MNLQTNQYNSGWICPKCGAINSPLVQQCPCSTLYNRQYDYPYPVSGINEAGNNLPPTHTFPFIDNNDNYIPTPEKKLIKCPYCQNEYETSEVMYIARNWIEHCPHCGSSIIYELPKFYY